MYDFSEPVIKEHEDIDHYDFSMPTNIYYFEVSSAKKKYRFPPLFFVHVVTKKNIAVISPIRRSSLLCMFISPFLQSFIWPFLGD